jgi:hypothetical protein
MNRFRMRALGLKRCVFSWPACAGIVLAAGGCNYHGGHTGQPVVNNTTRSSIVSTAKFGADDVLFLPPVLRLVHRRIAPNPTPIWGEYFAMYAPWPPGSDNRFEVGIETAIEPRLADADAPLVPNAGFGLAYPPFGSLESDAEDAARLLEDVEVSYFSVIDGAGWAYLTGKHPKIRTKRVIGGSDGTTFIVSIRQVGPYEYHRFALLDPDNDPAATKTVKLKTNVNITNPTKEVTLTAALPCTAFVYDSVNPANSYWIEPVAVVGPNTDRRWYEFRDAILQSKADAESQGLPFDRNPPI